jgi:hypothetical protein
MVDAPCSDDVHLGQLTFMSGSLLGDVKQRTNLERVARASAPSEVGGSRFTCSMLWHYHNRVGNLQRDDMDVTD